MSDEMAKRPHSDHFENTSRDFKKVREINGQTLTSGHTESGLRSLGGVSFPC
jgi:hypothetical protein